MLDVITVCKSGGLYDADWVRKLSDGLKRNLTIPYRFRCLSDIELPNRVPLQHDWDGWWSKIEMFRPGFIENPTLYLDLDTVITGNLDGISNIKTDFAMLQSVWHKEMVGSGVMWFSGENVPTGVYNKFVRQADAYIAHHKRNENGPYLGDQAFIWDTLDRNVDIITRHYPGIRSYKIHCRKLLPEGTSIVYFHGLPRLTEIDKPWIVENWK